MEVFNIAGFIESIDPGGNSMKRFFKFLILFFITWSLENCIIAQSLVIPVKGATPANWHGEYFWNCPWCKGDRVHYGIDIIKPQGTPVLAATYGIVVYRNWHGRGGMVIMVYEIGANRLHYYAHFSHYAVERWDWINQGDLLGYVGNTGASDLPHLHYGIMTFFPYPWRWSRDKSGWRKMFFLNPHDELMKSISKF
jgi:peptidoglycan LD-endopeptidase LytH